MILIFRDSSEIWFNGTDDIFCSGSKGNLNITVSHAMYLPVKLKVFTAQRFTSWVCKLSVILRLYLRLILYSGPDFGMIPPTYLNS